MGKQIVCIILLWFVSTANAQKSALNIKQVDSTTYALYLKQDWKPIIALGKQSRTEGVDFYYLKVRMGIAYFKEKKMLSAIQMLEEAYTMDPSNVVVQDYLYWSYCYSGLIMESRLFYSKMSDELKDKIKLDLPFVSDISFNVLTTNNLDYNEMLLTDTKAEIGDFRFIRKNQQMFSLGLSHPLSKRINLFHQFTIIPTTSVQQENIGGILENETYKGIESRYYADVTISLENRWYLDTYLNVISGKYDNVNAENTSSSSKIKYTDMLFGGTVTKASYFIRNSLNVSVSNLNGSNQFQAGYALSLYPLGSTLIVPFGSIQYQAQDSDSNLVFTLRLSANFDQISIIGFGTSGKMNNFIANNGAIIYNQSATALNEFGGSFNYLGKRSILKVGYSFMNMEDNYYNDNFKITSKTFEFNQQSIIAGITWIF
jgi:hypothetical protein